ncbi:MAG: hypothetical protein ACREEO_04745, partial [Phenylobacterium sp.]
SCKVRIAAPMIWARVVSGWRRRGCFMGSTYQLDGNFQRRLPLRHLLPIGNFGRHRRLPL